MSFAILKTTQGKLEKGWEVLTFDKIDSTNNYAKANIEKLNPPTLLMAEHQTHGRGRGANDWEDSGQNQYFLGTFVLAMNQKAIDPRWTMALGLFVYESFKVAWPEGKFSIKAPNDIFLDEKKLAGILVENCESNGKNYLVIGLGINIFSHPETFDHSATHLAASLPSLKASEWEAFISQLAEKLEMFESFVHDPHWLANISQNLKSALNLNPQHRNNPVKEILENGSLELHQGYLHWLEL